MSRGSVYFTVGVRVGQHGTDEQLLLFISTRSLKRGHPNPGFIQTVRMLSIRSLNGKGEGGVPEQFSYKLSEIDAFFRNKVKSQFSSIPAQHIVSDEHSHTPMGTHH